MSSSEDETPEVLQQFISFLGLRRSLRNPVQHQPGLERRAPDTAAIRNNPITEAITQACGMPSPFHEGAEQRKVPLVKDLRDRELRGIRFQAERVRLTNHLIPKALKQTVRHNGANIFCGKFSKEGEVYMSASQDGKIRLFNYPFLTSPRVITARNVGWSIIDTDYSPDQRFLIYSSWSPFVYLRNVTSSNFETHIALQFTAATGSFCLFSIKFSHASNEILGGANDGRIYVYDLASEKVVLKVEAHYDDINAVSFADEIGNLIFSGSDDRLCKVWDRRSLNSKKPVGVMVGHLEGITHIDSKGDSTYFISNGKDNSIKLWDLRRMSSSDTPPPSLRSEFDYRHGYGGIEARKLRLPQDHSIMTYAGHSVRRTLIRSHFSPSFTTGQRYIYSGSADGAIYVWDVLTGDLVKSLPGHEDIVRDVSWHPFEPVIYSSSWDGTMGIWE